MMERTLMLIKPDAIRRRLIGEVLRRVETKGYDIVALKLEDASRARFERQYGLHRGRDFFNPLIDFMMSGPSIAAVLQGDRVIEGLRSLAGTGDPTTAAPGTIRGDLARDWHTPVYHTLVHASDSAMTAHAEIEIWFPDSPGLSVVPSTGGRYSAGGEVPLP
jgi:nucleoside-diphosphate kinase